MVTPHSIRTRGIQVERYLWGLWIKGTREILTQDGYAQDGPFPGDPGERKCVVRTTDPEGRSIEIHRASKYLFVVRRHWNEEEAAAFRKAEEKSRADQEEIERAKRLVASWPASPDKFREDARIAVETGLVMAEKILTEGVVGGYRYDNETVDRIRFLAGELRGLIETGSIVKDMTLRERHIPACIEKSVKATDGAKSDKTFQQWLIAQGIVTK